MTLRQREEGTSRGQGQWKIAKAIDPMGWRIIGSGVLEGVSRKIRGGRGR